MKKANLLDLYTDFLMTSPGIASALVMSKVLQDSYSHDSITRMLAQDEIEQSLYWKMIKPTIRQVESSEGVISVDDTIENKPYSEENELISWHFDHTVGKSVKGINIVTFNYSSSFEDLTTKLPVAFDLVRKDLLVEKTEKKDGKFVTRTVRQASVSKIELVRQRLQVLVFQNHVQFKYVTFDTWYSDAGLMTYIVKDLKKHCVCAIKENRNICLDFDKPAKQRSFGG
jgi:DDE superfamily endonuclease